MKLKFLAIRISFIIAIIGFLFSCTTTDLPTSKERTSIQDGKLAIALFRIVYEYVDGTPIDPFKGIIPEEMISFGLGSFLAKGKAKRVRHRFISPETRKKGWTYLILEPGIHYLVFQGPTGASTFDWYRQLRYGPRFKLNIPMNSQLVYLGTLRFSCLTESTRWGERICWKHNSFRTDVRDEKFLLEKFANEYLSNFESPQTSLMQRVY